MVIKNRRRQFRFCGLLIDSGQGWMRSVCAVLLTLAFWSAVFVVSVACMVWFMDLLYQAIDQTMMNNSLETVRFLAETGGRG